MLRKQKGQDNTPDQVEKSRGRQFSMVSIKSSLGSWQEWLSMLFLFLTLEIAVCSIERAQWITPQPLLTAVLVLAIIVGWGLSRSRLPSKATHPLAIFLGVAVMMWQGFNLLPPSETATKLEQLTMALQSWWQAASLAEPIEGTIHFAILLIFFTWIIGYISTWFVLRRQNAWVAVFLGAVVIMVNLSNLPEKHYVFFFLFALAVILLLGQMNLTKHYYWFRKHGINYPKRGLVYFTALVLCLGIMATSLAWLMPELRVSRVESIVSYEVPWRKNIENYLTNLLDSVPVKQPILKSSWEGELLFNDYSDRNETDLRFVITSKQPYYWRTHVYDIYTSLGWTSSETTEHMLSQAAPSIETGGFTKRNEVSYTVLTKLRTDVLLIAGEFISSDTPVIEVTQSQVGAGCIMSVFTPYFLRPGERYTITASISSAIPADLSQAGEDYPRWVTEYYLQLPPTFPERVKQLSETITEEAKSPYDKALAIGRYLAELGYNPENNAPPQGADGVDYFLFTSKTGNCAYFASATAVMLRAVGVPTRLCVGYRPGEWDAAKGIATIRVKNYHAWAEIYFPGYGWIEYETTPAGDSGGSGGSIGVIKDGLSPPYRGWEYWMYSKTTSGNTDSSGAVTISKPSRLGSTLFLTFIIIIGVATLLYIVRSAIWAWLRRFGRLKGPDYTSEIYAKMCSVASWLRIGPKPQETPLEYSARLSLVFPMSTADIDRIAQAYSETRFSSRRGLERLQGILLRKSWVVFYQVLLKQLFQMRNWLPW